MLCCRNHCALLRRNDPPSSADAVLVLLEHGGTPLDDVRSVAELEREIAQLRRANEELARRSERDSELAKSETLAALVRSAVDGIVTTDERGHILSFNPAAERMFGWAAHEVIGQGVGVLMPSPHRERHEAYMRRYVVGGTSSIIGVGRELEGVTKDGRTFPMHLALSELSIGGGRMFAGFIRDLTEHKRLEEQLRHAQKMEALGALTSGIAHDFGNLLMGITGCANIALARLELDHPIARYLRELSEAAKRGSGLTRQLMAFSRKQAPRLAALDVDAVIGTSAGLLRRLVGDDIEIQILSHPRHGAVVADAGQLEQVLVNLVVNARDAMPAGGRIEIATDELVVEPRDAAAHGLPLAGRSVKLEVRDTGHGMDEATRRRIFEPFFTTKEVGKGTGLGLSTVYGIVKQLRGSIEVESEPGRGTTFTLLLPCTDAPLPAAQQDGSHEPPHGDETVLIVDDDRLVRLSVRHYLEALGYRVEEALEPSDALRACREPGASFDLLLTDVVMPGIGGPTLARQVRALHPEIRVLLMSAHPTDELVARGALEPGDALLGKPFGPAQLAIAVRRVLDASEHPPAAAERPADAEPASVLVVEDNASARIVVRELLEEAGYRVIAVGTAAAALEAIADQNRRVDLLLTDVSLPDARGDWLARHIRETLPTLPVVYMSGYDSATIDRLPGDGYLTKPFDLDDLAALVTQQLERAQRPGTTR